MIESSARTSFGCSARFSARAIRCETPVMSTVTIDEPRLPEGPGSVIGPYRLLQRIGEGGMGVVYLAEQTIPIRRKVALKIIKPGMDSRQVIARFEAERQALALMDHPNIAKVYDAGTTDSGLPFFVMELVKGVSITRLLRRSAGDPARANRASRARLPGHPARTSKGRHPPRHQALECADFARMTASPRPR